MIPVILAVVAMAGALAWVKEDMLWHARQIELELEAEAEGRGE